MIHLPVIENRIAQFAARFELCGKDGWAYHHDRATGGLPVSDEERAALLEGHVRALRLAVRVMYGWLAVAVIGLLIVYIRTGRDVPFWQEALVFLLPFPWAIWHVARAERAPFDLAGRRVPVTRPRTAAEGIRSRVAAFPASVPVMMIGVGALLLVQLVRLDQWRESPLEVALGIGVIVFGAWIFLIRRSVQRRGP